MKEYFVCWGTDPDLLEENVDEQLQGGWELYGNPFFGKGEQEEKFSKMTGRVESIPGKSYFCQAMVREKKE